MTADDDKLIPVGTPVNHAEAEDHPGASIKIPLPPIFYRGSNMYTDYEKKRRLPRKLKKAYRKALKSIPPCKNLRS
jgi:hypothetical protein